MRSRLLPCPFCGSKAREVEIREGENCGAHYIECSNAECAMTSNLQWSEKGNEGFQWLRERWNRRVSATEAELDALRQELAEATVQLKVDIVAMSKAEERILLLEAQLKPQPCGHSMVRWVEGHPCTQQHQPLAKEPCDYRPGYCLDCKALEEAYQRGLKETVKP